MGAAGGVGKGFRSALRELNSLPALPVYHVREDEKSND